MTPQAPDLNFSATPRRTPRVFMRSSRLLRLLLALGIAFITIIQLRLLIVHDDHGENQRSGSSLLMHFLSKNHPSTTINGHNLLSSHSHESSSTLCDTFSHEMSASSIWNRHLGAIFEAMIHPDDVGRLHKAWMEKLLRLLSPKFLHQAVKATPNSASLGRTIHILSKRIEKPDLNPPLKIFVFGGSIVEGVGCEAWAEQALGVTKPKGRSKNKGPTNKQSFRQCAWPFRLQHLINTLANQTLIQVENLSVGGTHSEAAQPMLEYWLSPVFPPNGADIIVNAYSANDNLPPAFHATGNTTVDNFHSLRILKRNLGFIQSARASRPCRGEPPLVYYVDDYLGNQQPSLLGDGSLDEMIEIIAKEGHLGYISAAQMVRKFVVGDSAELVFSPDWKQDEFGNYTVNVHFGMPGHVTTMLAVAYSMLETTVRYCEEMRLQGSGEKMFGPIFQKASKLSQRIPPDLVDFDLSEWEKAQRASGDVTVALPNDFKWISSKTFSKAWTDLEGRRKATCNAMSSLDNGNPCAFAFLAAPLGTHQGAPKLQSFLSNYMSLRGGWLPQNDFRHGGFQNKLGLVAITPRAATTIHLKNLQTPIRVITVHYLKSYGPQWDGSVTKFTLEAFRGSKAQGNEDVFYTDSFLLEGSHNQTTSISYTHRLDLTEAHQAPVGSSIRFHLQLISGRSFKINALMLCSR